jgi:type II secretory pathway component PulC
VSLFDRFQDLVHDGPRWARPQVVLSALFVVALLAQVGTVAWPVLRHKLDARTGQGAGAPVATGPTLTLRPGLSIATIIAGHLFGAAAPEVGSTEKTALPLELMGTFAADDPASGIAFLREGPGGPQHLFRVGETLPGGGVLRGIYRARIVFARDGRMEELSFPERHLAFAPPPSLASLGLVETGTVEIPASGGQGVIRLGTGGADGEEEVVRPPIQMIAPDPRHPDPVEEPQ